METTKKVMKTTKKVMATTKKAMATTKRAMATTKKAMKPTPKSMEATVKTMETTVKKQKSMNDASDKGMGRDGKGIGRSAKGCVKMSGKLRRCVSRKFYVDIDSRLRVAATCIGGGEEMYAAMKAMIDMYISEGIVVGGNADERLKLVFAMLRPEIDKAMARSRMARERAKGRMAKVAVEPAESPEADCSDCQASVPMAKSADCEENNRTEEYKIPTDSDIEEVVTMAMREVAGDDSLTYRLTRRQRRRLEQERRRRFGKTKNTPLGK